MWCFFCIHPQHRSLTVCTRLLYLWHSHFLVYYLVNPTGIFQALKSRKCLFCNGDLVHFSVVSRLLLYVVLFGLRRRMRCLHFSHLKCTSHDGGWEKGKIMFYGWRWRCSMDLTAGIAWGDYCNESPDITPHVPSCNSLGWEEYLIQPLPPKHFSDAVVNIQT